VDRVPAIAAFVVPLLAGRVRRRPAGFHAQPVFLVEVVQVPATGLLPDPRLSPVNGDAR
jgi:hypothetical protein